MKIQNGAERYFHSIYRCPSFKRLSHRSEFNSGAGECFHCSRWTVIERNRDKDHLDLLTPRTRTWIDEMKEASNVFQFHSNCCLKLKETIRPRSVLHSKESTERKRGHPGPEMDPVPPQRSWLHIRTAVWQKWQGWCHSSTLENPEYVPVPQQLKWVNSGFSKDNFLRCLYWVVKLPGYSLSVRSFLLRKPLTSRRDN